MIASAVIFGLGFGTAYPVYVGYVMKDVGPERRGAVFGAILAAFDTGIGTGSTLMGWLIQEYGFAAAFGTAAALSGLALPYFLVADRALRQPAGQQEVIDRRSDWSLQTARIRNQKIRSRAPGWLRSPTRIPMSIRRAGIAAVG